ncbi:MULTISPECIES: phage terminase small subunit P27 family [Pseudomonas]|jgi:P27 family predicted phage terminase small subunit|uniref:P27 family predicted phage terminase small subunit n=1 Tax=Pseudomonas jessenii TaxID=77298 RepID=A0A370SJN9_PSEJE|nr:phage terminase small subunit P27 family [Pseudomonas jessenii]RDL19976.1 P27 family predicted phage terminase small subunit [Pseudomonas jessenii]
MAGNGNSGRPALPASLKLLQGNRGRENVASLLAEVAKPLVPVGAPPMPDVLSPEAVKEWEELVPALISLGIVSQLDAMALATYCQAVADWRRYQRLIAKHNADSKDGLGGDIQTFKTGAQQMHVLRQLANDAEKRANAAGAQFGLSPMSRRNLKTAPAPQGDLFPNDQRDAADRYFS